MKLLTETSITPAISTATNNLSSQQGQLVENTVTYSISQTRLFAALPVEVVALIANFVEWSDLNALRLTCSSFSNAVDNIFRFRLTPGYMRGTVIELARKYYPRSDSLDNFADRMVSRGANALHVINLCGVTDVWRINRLQKKCVEYGGAAYNMIKMRGSNLQDVILRYGITEDGALTTLILEAMTHDGVLMLEVLDGGNVAEVLENHGVSNTHYLYPASSTGLQWISLEGPAGREAQTGENANNIANKYGIVSSRVFKALKKICESPRIAAQGICPESKDSV